MTKIIQPVYLNHVIRHKYYQEIFTTKKLT